MSEKIANKTTEIFFKEIEILNLQHGKFLDYTHSNFNIFTIIREGSEEVGLHSTFISELLNPKGSHQMGGVFLKLFLKIINSIINQTNIELDIEKTTVETEKWIGNIDGDKGGTIDIYITDCNYKIAIENKIYAKDQPKQLLRYHNFIKYNHSKSFLFYLTLDSHSPSDNSRDKLKKEDFHNISYRDDILKWLEACKEKVCDIPRISEPIQQYIDLVKELTGQSLNHGYIMAIKDFIIKDPKNLKLAKDITEAFEELRKDKDIANLFLEDLCSSLKNLGINVERKDYNGDQYQGIEIPLDNYDFVFRVEIERRICFGFHFSKTDNDQNKVLADKYRNKLSTIYNNYKFTPEINWLGWTWINTAIVKDFDFKNFNTDEIFKLADETERENLINNLVEEIEKMIQKFNDEFSAD